MIDWQAAVRNWARGQAKETVVRPQIKDDPELDAGKERIAKELRAANKGMNVTERMNLGRNA